MLYLTLQPLMRHVTNFLLLSAVILTSSTALGLRTAQPEEEIRQYFTDRLDTVFSDRLNPAYQLVMAAPLTVTSLDEGAGENWEITIPVERLILTEGFALSFAPITVYLQITEGNWHFHYDLPETLHMQSYVQDEWVMSGTLLLSVHQAQGVWRSYSNIWESFSYSAQDATHEFGTRSVLELRDIDYTRNHLAPPFENFIEKLFVQWHKEAVIACRSIRTSYFPFFCVSALQWQENNVLRE